MATPEDGSEPIKLVPLPHYCEKVVNEDKKIKQAAKEIVEYQYSSKYLPREMLSQAFSGNAARLHRHDMYSENQR